MRRLRIWLLLLVFGIALSWWVLSVPRRPDRLYDAIPPSATLVSTHEDIAGRWDTFSANPVSLALLSSVGLDPASLDELSRDATFRSWLDGLASGRVVVAYVPSLGETGMDAWVLASWIGGRSQRLRWMLGWTKSHPCRKLGEISGRAIWAMDSALLSGGRRLSFALDEGVLLACVSRHPAGVRYMLDAYDRRTMRDADVYEKARQPLPCGVDMAWDRGCIVPPLSRTSLSYALSCVSTSSLAGAICMDGTWPSLTASVTGVDYGGLGRMLGDLPLAVMLLTPDAAEPVMQEMVPGVAGEVCNALIQALHPRAVALGVLGGELSGRLMGLKLPCLVLGLQLHEPETARDVAGSLLDGLNGRYRWGLVPQDVPAGEVKTCVLEGTADNAYTRLSLGERVGYVLLDDWLYIVSNADALLTLTARYQRSEAGRDGARGRWFEFVKDYEAGAYAWVDLARGGKTVRLALTAYSIDLMRQDPEGSRARRQRINEAKAWIDSMAPLSSCRLWLSSADPGLSLRIEMGGP